MSTFVHFLFEFISVFFDGIIDIFKGFFNGIVQIFNFKEYLRVFNYYKGEFGVSGWILGILVALVVLALMALLVFLVVVLIRKYFRFRKTLGEQESMLDEIGNLNKQVNTLVKEKEKLLAMKVSNLGLKPGQGDSMIDEPAEGENNEAPEGEASGEQDLKNMNLDNVRFTKLHEVDIEFANYKPQNYGNTFTLPELVETFRNFAASKLHLYYTSEMIRIFISGLACTRLIILQGISGTGKTSLAYAFGKFIKHDAIIASVQPSWRDRTFKGNV